MPGFELDKRPRIDTSSSKISITAIQPSRRVGHRLGVFDKSARAGVIERVSLRNFKCHSLLEFNFHDRINFILGLNGSGKSAVMDAIILILGGRAACTGRQASAKTFIKTNAE